MNKKIKSIISSALCTLALINAAHTTVQNDPLQEVDQFMRTQITNWSGQLKVSVPTQTPNSKAPALVDLLAPLMGAAFEGDIPIYNQLVVQVETRGMGTCMVEFANSFEKLDPKATEAIKETMDQITDPADKVTIIKLLTQIQYMREATLRANPKTQLILQDVFELAKQQCGGTRTTFQDIVSMCESLDRIRAIRKARHAADTPGTFDIRTRKQLLEAHPLEAKPTTDRPTDYYVPSYYYIFGIVPRSHVVLLALGLSWDDNMPGPERDLLKEQVEKAMNDYLLMAKMNCWADTIIDYAKQTVGLNDDEVTLLSNKLDDVRFADPDPNNTLKARQAIMETIFQAVRTALNLRTLGVEHANLFTYLLFMNGDALWTLDQFCSSMCNNLKLEQIRTLWDNPPKPVLITPALSEKRRWFGWW